VQLVPMTQFDSELVVSRVMTTPESGESWAGFARFEELLARASEDETAWHIQCCP
jgi:hypothetical protein